MPALLQELALLEHRGLVRVSLERPRPLVRFKHALTREATYNSMLQARRAELHRAAAQTLNALNPEPDLEMVLTIAEHWQSGSEDGAALAALLPHTQRLIYTGRSVSLTALLERLARENLTGSQQRDLDIALADAQAARGEYEPARKLYDHALQTVDTLPMRARLLHSQGVAAYHLGDNENALAYHRESYELAQELGDVALQARTLSGLGVTYWRMNEMDQAESHLKQSKEQSLKLGPGIELANAEFNLAGIQLDRGDFVSAIQEANRALELDQTFGHQALAARTYQIIGACYYNMGDLTQAKIHYERALQSSRDLQDHLGIALGEGNLGELYAELGELDASEAFYESAIKNLRKLAYEYLLPYNLIGLARVQLKKTKGAGAPSFQDPLQNANEALSIAERLKTRDRAGMAHRILAQIYAKQGDRERAVASAHEAVRLLQDTGQAGELEHARAELDSLLQS